MDTDSSISSGTSGEIHPEDTFTITSLETLKVFSDPLRQQIIEALMDGAKTVKQIASLLDVIPTKLYYHINLMEEHGLITVTDTRIVSGIIEKHYGLSARNFNIRHTLLTPGGKDSANPGFDAIMDATINRAQNEIRRAVQSGAINTAPDAPTHRKVSVGRGRSYLTPAQAEEFYARMNALVEEFEAQSAPPDSHGEAALYVLSYAIYPLSNPADE